MLTSLLAPGARLGKYEVVAHVASGGMGAVYKALDLELRRAVALKVLPAEQGLQGPLLERFRREARHAARLSHPNIVTLFECGHDAKLDLHYLALEFIEGIDLAMYIQRRGQLPPEEARRILIQAAKALDHAFAQGIIHRDIKPSNFMLAKVDHKVVIKMTDLGLALGVNDQDFKVTRDGITVGTIDYIAPEQARDSQSASIRSDIYSLGCTAYHMLAGKAPFAEGGIAERVYKLMNVPAPDIRQFNAAVSDRFWAILVKMLAKNPEDRYATPSELLSDLKQMAAETSTEECKKNTVLEVTRECKTEYVPKETLPEVLTQPSAAPISSAPPQAGSSTPQLSSSGIPVDDLDSDSEHQEKHPRKRRSKPRLQLETLPSMLPPDPTLISLEQARTAAAYHERAVEVLAQGGGIDYARELLGNCMKQDPFTIAYRKTLREMNRKAAGGTLSRWFGSLNVLATKSRMRLDRTSGHWRKVLEHGEDVLAHHPADADTHLAMAEAAENLALPHLTMWLLEQGLEQAPENIDLIRAMARLYEKRDAWKVALTLWEKVAELDPTSHEAQHKMNELSVKDHIAGGHYRR